MSYKRNKQRDVHRNMALSFEKAVPFTVQKTATLIPVTTRAVGFYVQCLFKNIYELFGRRSDYIPKCSPYALYRVTLAQFEYRLLRAKRAQMQSILLPDYNLFYTPRLTEEDCNIIQTMTVTFSSLTNLLAGIGNFEFKGQTYYSSCPQDDVLGILFSNLRRTVAKMANAATSHTERRMFYELNPLPFAQWNRPQRGVEDPSAPILMNPDDYMPVTYGCDDLLQDVEQVKNLIAFVSLKESRMVSTRAIIDYDAPGHQRILVSNNAAGLRNPDRLCPYADNWKDEEFTQGEPDRFWSPNNISNQEFFVGIIDLVGERRDGTGDAFTFRSPMRAQQICSYRWSSLAINLT